MGERAEHPADGVAQLAIGIDIGLDDGLAEALVIPIIGGHDPQAQDIGTGVLHDFLRRDHVALGLGHLLALLIHGETMGGDGVVRRTAARRAAFQQRRMEPAAMLVGTFEIDVRRPLHVRAVFQREGVGAAAIEPHVEDIHDLQPLVVVVVIAEEALLGAFGEPGVSTFGLESLEDAGVDGLIDQNLALLIGEDGDRHAPAALARQDPVGPAFDHGAQAVLPEAGTKRVWSMALKERERSVVPSPSSLSI